MHVGSFLPSRSELRGGTRSPAGEIACTMSCRAVFACRGEYELFSPARARIKLNFRLQAKTDNKTWYRLDYTWCHPSTDGPSKTVVHRMKTCMQHSRHCKLHLDLAGRQARHVLSIMQANHLVPNGTVTKCAQMGYHAKCGQGIHREGWVVTFRYLHDEEGS